jgi:hypothetical protein
MNEPGPAGAKAGESLGPSRGWTALPAAHLPSPTFWPAGLALAITLAFWGLVSSPVILAAGLALLVLSLLGWIKEIRHERKHAK